MANYITNFDDIKHLDIHATLTKLTDAIAAMSDNSTSYYCAVLAPALDIIAYTILRDINNGQRVVYPSIDAVADISRIVTRLEERTGLEYGTLKKYYDDTL